MKSSIITAMLSLVAGLLSVGVEASYQPQCPAVTIVTDASAPYCDQVVPTSCPYDAQIQPKSSGSWRQTDGTAALGLAIAAAAAMAL